MKSEKEIIKDLEEINKSLIKSYNHIKNLFLGVQNEYMSLEDRLLRIWLERLILRIILIVATIVFFIMM